MTQFTRHSHCAYCGTPFAADQPWPRKCTHCRHTSFVNPLPVAVMLLPVDEGLLVVRRSIQPGYGKLALPGGYIELGESWQAAAARELQEETGVTIDLAEIREFLVRSAPDSTLLVFGLAQPRRAEDLPPFTPLPEASERLVIDQPQPMAFSTHSEAVEHFFRRSSVLRET